MSFISTGSHQGLPLRLPRGTLPGEAEENKKHYTLVKNMHHCGNVLGPESEVDMLSE